MAVHSYRDLRVWQLGMELVESIYQLSSIFPKSELYGLTNQLRRAAVSVPSNIAEGHTREHLKEYLHHISMAQGSLAEVETQIQIAFRLNYLSKEQLEDILKRSEALGKQLYALRNALSVKVNSGKM